MQMTELDVVNDCLSTLGELPVNTLDDDHNLIAAARRAFATCNLREQAKQWWFNTERVTLTRDSTGSMYTPGDSIRCDPVDSTLPYIQRGRRMYDTGTATGAGSGYDIAQGSLDCWLVRQIEFEDLPPSAQVLVAVSAQLKFMAAYDADSQRYRQLLAEYQEAYMIVNSEHIRNNQSNMLEKHPTIGRLRSIAGYNINRLMTPGL